MKCPVWNEKQLDLTAETERHLTGCPDCRQARAEQAALLALLEEFEAPAVSLDFNRRLWQKLEATPERGLVELLRDWMKPAIPLAAAAALVVVGFLYDHRVTSPVPASVSTVEADSVERTLDDMQLLGQFEKTL